MHILYKLFTPLRTSSDEKNTVGNKLPNIGDNDVYSTIFSVNYISCPKNISLGLVPFSESGISKYSSLKKESRTHTLSLEKNHIINLRNFECKSEHCLFNSNNLCRCIG